MDAEFYKREMDEFAEMADGIRDIDWYKAATEAARNGQTTAMEFADAKAKEATQARNDLESYKKLVMDRAVRLMPWIIVGWLITLVIAYQIGVWTS